MIGLLFLMWSVIANASEPLKVAIIDTGLDLNDPRFSAVLCKKGHRDFTGEGIDDVLGHGTHITGLIKENAKDSNYCLIIYKCFHSDEKHKKIFESHFTKALVEASKQDVAFVNISGGGSEFYKSEYEAIKNHPKIKFVVAAGNDGENLDSGKFTYYPASYGLPNIVVVGSGHSYMDREPYSNFSITAVWEYGTNVFSTLPRDLITHKYVYGYLSGTSMSTAIRTGKMIYEATH